jgi:hypothetical protein
VGQAGNTNSILIQHVLVELENQAEFRFLTQLSYNEYDNTLTVTENRRRISLDQPGVDSSSSASDS